MKLKTHFFLLLLISSFQIGFSQENLEETNRQKEFSVKVVVLDKATNTPIENARVAINGNSYPYLFRRRNYVVKAKTAYQTALSIAKKHLVTSKITDINSKLATLFERQGNVKKAGIYYQNSLNLASKESSKRVLKEQDKVADFTINLAGLMMKLPCVKRV